MKKLAVIALLTLCGCRHPQPVVSRPQPATQIERSCRCWLHREWNGNAGCPCAPDCSCAPKAKCGVDCHCGEPKK